MNDDKIITEYLEHPESSETSKKTRIKHYIKKRFSHSSGASTLCVIFPPWHGKFNYDILLRRKILHNNSSCLEYEFSSKILSADYKSTQHFFEKIRDSSCKDIEELRHKHGFHSVHLIAFSLGTVNAMMVGNRMPYVNKMILHNPGDSLAGSLWHGIRTQNIKKGFEKQGLSLSNLESRWQGLAPAKNVDKLKGKEVHVILSQKDSIIPYEHGLKLVKSLKKNKVKMKVKEKKHSGHYISIMLDFLFPEDI